jgi:long-chain fatty acid transport protein
MSIRNEHAMPRTWYRRRNHFVTNAFVPSVLLFLATIPVVHADVGPALTGLTATASNATTAFTNPAGMTRIDQPEVTIQTLAAVTASRFKVDESNVDGGDADRDVNVLPVPGLFYTHPLGERWRLGAAFTVPGGIGHNYGGSWAGRYHAKEATLDFFAFQGSVAYRFDNGLSIGGGPLVMYTDSETRAQINNLEPGRPDGKVKLEESGAGLGWTVGMMYEFSERTRVGAIYRSEIDPELSGDPEFNDLGPGIEALLQASGAINDSIDVDFKIPEQLQIGIYHDVNDKLSVTADGIWVNMSRFGINSVSVGNDGQAFTSSDFRDVWVGSVGLNYKFRPDLVASIGALYATSPVSDKDRTIALPLDRVISVGAGLDWKLSDGISLKSGLNYADFGDGDVEASGDPLLGDFKGSFAYHYAVILDIQLSIRF